jgi:hypothetical protein
LAFCACASEQEPGALGAAEQEVSSAKASISLSNASAAFVQTGDSSWTLAKTGTVDTSNHHVNWTITATKISTVAGHLVVDGYMSVTNSGAGGATIGNIVLNLQTKSGSTWTTRASDIADATHDDAATTAHIDPHASSEGHSTFSESAASGQLKFMDALTNTIFSLSPQVTVPGGATVNLLFSGAFDNNVLQLSVGQSVRAEVIVSFGNASNSGSTATNVDINGNGVIDADETRVRSVPARITGSVPAQTAANATPALSDSAANIATTGTVTYSNASFNLGATTGTATVTYDGGTGGGTITNCATLTGTGATTTVGGFTFPDVIGTALKRATPRPSARRRVRRARQGAVGRTAI